MSEKKKKKQKYNPNRASYFRNYMAILRAKKAGKDITELLTQREQLKVKNVIHNKLTTTKKRTFKENFLEELSNKELFAELKKRLLLTGNS